MSKQSGAVVKILTIEDESVIRMGIVAYLEDSGYQMLEADDGPTGVEIFKQEHRRKHRLS